MNYFVYCTFLFYQYSFSFVIAKYLEPKKRAEIYLLKKHFFLNEVHIQSVRYVTAREHEGTERETEGVGCDMS